MFPAYNVVGALYHKL